MNAATNAAKNRRQHGLGLVEMMVALGLGLLVMLTGSAMLVAASANYLAQAAAGRLNDNGLYALEALTRALRQTAFVDWDKDDAPVATLAEDSANIAGLDGRTVSLAVDGIENPSADAINGSDVLAVRYFGTGTGSDGDGSVLNCAGFGVAAAADESGRGWSIFYVAADSAGAAELRCKYRGDNGWGGDAIVRGIDTFQVLYGLDTDAEPDGVANRYINASAVAALDAALPLAGVDAAARARELNRRSHWKRVVSVKIGLLLHDDGGAAPGVMADHVDLFGDEYGAAYGATDVGARIEIAALPAAQRRLPRRLLVATILLRNRAQ